MIAVELVAYRCANPACPSRRNGPGQVVMRGDNRPGWRGEGYCHQCRSYTLIEVGDDGTLTFALRRKSSTLGA
jgi:hypothetical protein